MRTLSVLAASMLWWFGAGGTALADRHCSIPGISFASCERKPRYFESVVIAIPGWNGDCKSTFGERDGHLLNAMRRQNFFDVDCFDYDSHGTVLPRSVEQLRGRVEALRKAGYRELTFVTHSTGGVLALDFLLAEALTAAEPQQLRTEDVSIVYRNVDGIRVRGVYTWAVPLNGLKPVVRRGGRLINLFGFSTKVLPDLMPDSEYLAKLKARLKAFDAALAAPPGGGSFGFEWVILQGQRSDEVVEPVNEADAWFPKNTPVHIVNTNSGHSYNVAISSDASGRHGRLTTPRYPAEIMSDKSKLAIGLYPRFKEYFSTGSMPDQAAGQRIILRGIVDFAGNHNLFPRARTAISTLFVTLLEGGFERTPQFDEEVVVEVGRLLRKLKDFRPAEVVSYVDLLAYDMERRLDAAKLARQLGSGSFRAVRRFPDLISGALSTASELVQREPGLASELQTSEGTLGKFQARALRILSVFLQVAGDDDTRARAVLALRAALATADSAAVLQSDVTARLRDYARANAKLLSDKPKADLAAAFAAPSGHTEEVRVAALAALSVDVEWLQGQQRPLWLTLLGDEQVRGLVALPLGAQPQAHLVFLESVIANGGPRGNSSEVASEAVDVYGRYLAASPSPELRDRLRAAAARSPFPAVAGRAERVLSRLAP